MLPSLLWELCSGPLPPAEQIDSAQALCKQLARLIDFVFRFDSLKMNTPAIQNDFSFFRFRDIVVQGYKEMPKFLPL